MATAISQLYPGVKLGATGAIGEKFTRCVAVSGGRGIRGGGFNGALFNRTNYGHTGGFECLAGLSLFTSLAAMVFTSGIFDLWLDFSNLWPIFIAPS